MRRRLIFLAALLAASFSGSSNAHAQRYNRNGPAMSAYGPVYNPTSSPDYQLYARNPAAYEQLMYQRQLQYDQKQQQELVKQQQAFQKWLKDQKAKKDKGQPTDPAYDNLLKIQAAQEAAALKAKAKVEAKKAAAQAKKEKVEAFKKKIAAEKAAKTEAAASTSK